MSGRRRRPEALWDRKEDEIGGGRVPWQGKESQSNFSGNGSPKRSNPEANDALMHRDFSREPMHGNEWENQYGSRPSDHGYDLPYRGGDRGVGGTGNMTKGRDRSRSRSWSPHQSSRGWDRDRGNSRGRERSRSRSRGRDPGRVRSPFDDERRELYESADVRNDSRVSSRSSRGGNRSDNDLTEKWGSRQEYSGGSRFRDDRNSADRPRTKGSDGYRKDTTHNKNAYDDQDQRRQWNQSTKPLPCRYFLAGNCNRNNCKFSHDAPQQGNNDRSWNERQPQDHTSASHFSDFQKSSCDFVNNKKPWNGPTWDDVESGGLDQVSREHVLDARSQNAIPEISGSQFTNVTTTTMPQGDSNVNMVIDNSNAYSMVSANTDQQFSSYDSMTSQLPLTLNGMEKRSDVFSNAPNFQSNGSAQGMFSNLDIQKPVEVQNEGREPQETSKSDTQKQILANALELLYSIPNAASSGAPFESTVVSQSMKTNAPMVPISNSLEPENHISVEPIGVPKTEQQPIGDVTVNEKRESEIPKGQQENTNPGKSKTQGKVEEDNIGNDEKAMRQFKVALVEFVKDILKPTWKEGKMNREVYKTIVKKAVDKVTSTIQGNQIPRTQEKIDQYLGFSKPKITKLVEAYVGRFLKA